MLSTLHRCWLLSGNNLSAWTEPPVPPPLPAEHWSSACSAVPAHHVSLCFPKFLHLPTAPRACTIIWAHADGRGDPNNRAAAPPAGGGRDAGKGRMLGGCRQILKSLGCHALEAGLGLVCNEKISQALTGKDMVRTYSQNVSGLRERQAGTERDWGGGGGLLQKCRPEGMTQDSKGRD